MIKDRKQTEDRLLSAVDDLVREKGFSSLGINSIARQAGVSKVLIYRYFNDFDGLLESWALKHSYWAEEHLSDQISENDWKQASLEVLGEHAEKLRSDKLRREVLRWLLTEKTAAGDRAMDKMEEKGLALMDMFEKQRIQENDSGIDTKALIALLVAAINYLSLYSDQCSVFNGVEINSESGWKRIESCIRSILESQF